MSSSHVADEISELRNKISQLEIKQRVQRMAQSQKIELIKRDAREEKKGMLHALENEKRDHLLENEKRDRLLENERRDRKDLEQKMEAALENEKRDRLLENEKRDRESERKALEQKMDHMKMEAALYVGNERRDRLLENEKRDLEQKMKQKMLKIVAALENERRAQKMGRMKMKMGAAVESEKRDRLLEIEMRERLLEDERRVRQAEKKEMMATLEKNEREQQHQIEQLKSEARISQMEQQLLEVRACTSQGISISRPTIQNTAAVHPAPHRDTELLLLQRIQQMEKERELVKATVPAVQPMTIPNKDVTSPLQAPDTSHKIALQPVSQKAAAVSQPSKGLSQQPSQISSHKPDTTTTALQPLLQPASHTSAVAPATTTSANAGNIPLPGDSHTHFFLSHCQSTGGDQTNAIYLELQKLGFSCWYDNRATDLTKEGMRKGIVHAAAFLLFLSKGVLERPFCELFLHCSCIYSSLSLTSIPFV
jgi:hypothetical protein